METINTITNDKWYTLKVLSNFEDKVKKLIEKRLKLNPSINLFFMKFLCQQKL